MIVTSNFKRIIYTLLTDDKAGLIIDCNAKLGTGLTSSDVCAIFFIWILHTILHKSRELMDIHI